MTRAVFPIFIVLAACSSSSASSSVGADASLDSSTDDSSTDGDAGAGSFPGDPPTAAQTGVIVKINGQLRAFPNAIASWEKTPSDGGMRTGFFVHATSSNGWEIVVGAFTSDLGTHTCSGDGSLSLTKAKPGAMDRSGDIEYGTSVGTSECSNVLTTYGPLMGDSVSGTFSGHLDLSWDPSMLSTTPSFDFAEGTFSAAQFADVPP